MDNLDKLYIGKIFKNYNHLCSFFNIEPKGKAGSNIRKSQIKELNRYFNYEKMSPSSKLVITEVYKYPLEKEDKIKNSKKLRKYENILTPREINGEFDGYYVYRHILNEEVIYVGKGCRRRAVHTSRRKYNMKLIEKEIVKRFDNEVEALNFEQHLINYYMSIGQCKYNSQKNYFIGTIREANNKTYKELKEKKFNEKINKDYESMFKYRI